MANDYTTGRPALRANLINTLFIAPRAQTNIFDLDYQLYLFELLHQVRLNRWTHYIGIAAAPMLYYSLGIQVGRLDLVFLAVFVGMHLGMALKNQLGQLVPIILGLHALCWLVSLVFLKNVLSLDGPWYLNPVLHLLLWPTLQGITHALEAKIPPPWGGHKLWATTRELFTKNPPHVALLAVGLFPMYAFLELISTPRLFFVIILRVARLLKLTPDWLSQLDGTIDTHIKAAHPALALEDFDALMSH
jgi:hypothetical protein